LDEAFLYAEAIDVTTDGRQRDKLREELTLAKIDHHAEAVDKLDVEGILAFAERILPRASGLWVQASLDYKQRLQQLFFPEGVADESVVSLTIVSWNQMRKWLGHLDSHRQNGSLRPREQLIERGSVEETSRSDHGADAAHVADVFERVCIQ
jgi:hypothetical protein